ncbi:MAG: L-serine ammonia-lyase, iron-sulfur-dependent, subunit alpha [Proteobacteria bacterium]|nr:serine dehydratase subunit alpha family protein [Desulfobacula sp.]MBU3951184.1 L-serine ammonia-lyase, iron-sulfur-dependent, subunit alpha [Pseudomonadota bacterium]MBU4130718.1 L-serine ammonia-lyase, iron-sulfur-dependent, subunit alpha [Pseudomonadota bacterium]
MDTIDKRYKAYLDILKEELVPAMGCTEPIAIAFAAARARQVLGRLPDRVLIEASDNIIKNVKSVVVPNTGNLKGIEASAAAGIVAGDADKILEVISAVDDQGRAEIKTFLETRAITVCKSKTGLTFDLLVCVFSGESSASVRISHYHTNIVLITKDEKIVFQNQECDGIPLDSLTDRSIMNVKDILEFAESVDLSEVADLLKLQVDYNMKIAAEGLRGDWGANIGSVLLEIWGDDIKVRAKALAAAGSDARMSGCELPVVIVSGSGNQGIAASVPVIEYAKALGVEQEILFRALLVSNLITIHQKTGIGRLSAYCGAVSAGVGAGAGITWLYGGRFKEVAHTIVNALAIVSGIICDGAKPSCAAKIAASIDAGILGFHMYQKGQQFYGGDGIVTKGVENTIANIGRLGRDGMRETDKEIIRIMIGE